VSYGTVMRNTARIIRYFYANINILNILLVLAIAATIIFAVLPLISMKTTIRLPQPKAMPAPTASATTEKPLAPSPLDYAVIGDNNLFHPERRIPPIKKDDKPLPKPDLVLYGTVFADDVVLAFVEDKKSPKTTPGRGQRQTVIRKGDVLTGFVLKEIEKDRIVLVRGEERMTVHLSDERKRKRNEGPPGAPGSSALSRAYPSYSMPGAPGQAQRAAPTPAPPSVTRRPAQPTPAPTPAQPQGARGGSR
jgi:hypothetical protein